MSEIERREPKTPPRGGRAAARVSNSRDELYEVLDSTALCHIACADARGVAVFPTLFWRDEQRLFWHGSPGSRLIRAASGQQVSIAVTRFDGPVLAHSAFHHSANYACALIEGTAEPCPEALKSMHLERLMDSLFPGRWKDVRPPNHKELKATTVLSVSLDQATVKSRAGNVLEDIADRSVPVWAGVIEFSHALRYLPDPSAPGAGKFSPPRFSRCKGAT